MKLSRRLIPAFAMLLVSAVLMSTASFAWFSINEVVIADGMAITATADSSLVIKGKSGSGFTSDTTYTSHGQNTYAGVELNPVSTANGKDFVALGKDMRVESEVEANASWTGDKGTIGANDVTVVDAVTDATKGKNAYVLESVYNIKNIGADSKVYVESITVTAMDKTNTDKAGKNEGLLLESIRVAVEITKDATNENATAPADATRLVYNAGKGNLIEDQGVIDATTKTFVADYTYTAQGTTGTTLGTLAADTVYEVHIYIWIEGQDQACTSAHVDLSQYAVEVQFKGEKVTQ